MSLGRDASELFSFYDEVDRQFFIDTRSIPQSPPLGAAGYGRLVLRAVERGEVDWRSAVDRVIGGEALARMNRAIDGVHGRNRIRRDLHLPVTTPFAMDLVVSLASNTLDELVRGPHGRKFDTIVPASLRRRNTRLEQFLAAPGNLDLAAKLFGTVADTMNDPEGPIAIEAERNYKPRLREIAEQYQDAAPDDPDRLAAMNQARGEFGAFIRPLVQSALAAEFGRSHEVDTFAHNITVGVPDGSMFTKHFGPAV